MVIIQRCGIKIRRIQIEIEILSGNSEEGISVKKHLG
jgi:hypothetical protein